jgi:hypothetical protein
MNVNRNERRNFPHCQRKCRTIRFAAYFKIQKGPLSIKGIFRSKTAFILRSPFLELKIKNEGIKNALTTV